MSDFDYKVFLPEAEALLEATKSCREDTHEPNEQDLRVLFTGARFNNAGCEGELHIVLRRGSDFGPGQVDTYHNLASLIALARLGAREVVRKTEETSVRSAPSPLANGTALPARIGNRNKTNRPQGQGEYRL